MKHGSAWRPLPLIGEALRRAVASKGRFVLLAVTGFGAFAAAFTLEHGVVAGLIGERNEALRRGSSVVLIDGVQPADRLAFRSSCTQVGLRGGVHASGGVVEPNVLALATFPGIAARSTHMDADAWQIWFPTVPVPDSGVGVGAGLAARTGLTVNDPLVFDSSEASSTSVAAVLDSERQFALASEWIVEVGPPAGGIDECWIELERAVDRFDIGWIESAFSGLTEFRIRPALPADPSVDQVESRFAERDSRWVHAGAVAAVGLLYLVVLFGRRGERALYVTMGLSRWEEYLMGLVESAVAFAFPAACGTAFSLWLLADRSGIEGRQATVFVLEGQAAAVLAATLLLPLFAASGRRTSLLEHLRS